MHSVVLQQINSPLNEQVEILCYNAYSTMITNAYLASLIVSTADRVSH